MTDRYVAKSVPNTIWYGVLDCQLDEWHKEDVETKFRTLELNTLRFTHKEAAEYKAAQLNRVHHGQRPECDRAEAKDCACERRNCGEI